MGIEGQEWAYKKLGSLGFSVKRMPYNCPFDILAGDKRVEVKIARPNNTWTWFTNLHHGGKLSESEVDVYLIILTGIPGCGSMPLYLLFPAPVKRYTIKFTFTSLLRVYHRYVDNWGILGTPQRETPTYLAWKNKQAEGEDN